MYIYPYILYVPLSLGISWCLKYICRRFRGWTECHLSRNEESFEIYDRKVDCREAICRSAGSRVRCEFYLCIFHEFKPHGKCQHFAIEFDKVRAMDEDSVEAKDVRPMLETYRKLAEDFLNHDTILKVKSSFLFFENPFVRDESSIPIEIFDDKTLDFRTKRCSRM